MDVQRSTMKLNRSSKNHQKTQQIFEGPPKSQWMSKGPPKTLDKTPQDPTNHPRTPRNPNRSSKNPTRRRGDDVPKAGFRKRVRKSARKPPKKTKRRITIHRGPGGAGGDGEGGVRLVVVFCFRGGRGKVGTQPIHNARSEGEFKESEDWSLLLLR